MTGEVESVSYSYTCLFDGRQRHARQAAYKADSCNGLCTRPAEILARAPDRKGSEKERERESQNLPLGKPRNHIELAQLAYGTFPFFRGYLCRNISCTVCIMQKFLLYHFYYAEISLLPFLLCRNISCTYGFYYAEIPLVPFLQSLHMYIPSTVYQKKKNIQGYNRITL